MIRGIQIYRNWLYALTDLIPRENVEDWLRYLRNEFPTIAFKASTQTQSDNLVRNSLHLLGITFWKSFPNTFTLCVLIEEK